MSRKFTNRLTKFIFVATLRIRKVIKE